MNSDIGYVGYRFFILIFLYSVLAVFLKQEKFTKVNASRSLFFFFPTSSLNILVLNPTVPATSNKDDLQQ